MYVCVGMYALCVCAQSKTLNSSEKKILLFKSPTLAFSFIGNTTLQQSSPYVSLEWGFVRHLRWRVRKVQKKTQCYASLQKLLNNLQRGVVFSFPECWNFLWFTLWNEQCNKTTGTFASSLFSTKPQLSILRLHGLFFPLPLEFFF